MKVLDIIDLIQLNDIQLWTVSTSDGDNAKVFDSVEDETLEARKSRFLEVMRHCKGGRFIFKGKKSKTDSRSNFRYEFENLGEGNSTSISGIQQPTIQGIPENKVQEMINEALEKADNKRRMDDLERENKELQKQVKEADNVTTRVLQRAEPYIGQLLGMVASKFIPNSPTVALGSTNATISDLNPAESAESEDEEMNRIETAINKWRDADADYLTVLEFIANFASSGDKISPFPMVTLDYTAIKEMLK